MKKILFVCTGNTCRSPMAEGILKDMARKKGIDIDVKSAGVFAFEGDKASQEAIEVLKEEDIDISDHRTKLVTEEMVEGADLVLTMSFSHKDTLLFKYPFSKEKIYSLKEYVFYRQADIQDPYGGGMKAYKETKEELKDVLEKLLEKIQE